DPAEERAADKAVDRLAPAAEQAGAADDGGGHRVQDELAGIGIVGAVLPVPERAEKDPGEPGGLREERERRERPGPTRGRVAPAGASRFRVTADRAGVPAELGALEQQRPDAHDTEV